MKRVLIIQEFIPHYRRPLYNLLAQYYDLTILHSLDNICNEDVLYKKVFLKRIKIGPFKFQKNYFKQIFQGYDFIIVMSDFHWPLNILGVFFHPKNTKYIYWGSWFTNKYFIDKLKVFFAKRADANIFYCENDRLAFYNSKVDRKKLFLANNTVEVIPRFNSSLSFQKQRILFVGTLDKRKELDVLIKAFELIIPKIETNIMLTIIGDGDCKNNLIQLTDELKINERVEFKGQINNTDTLRLYYSGAIASVSYGQAGLSVLQSLAFGVPFITKYNSISGGEKTNIIDGYNGFLCDGTIKDLSIKLLTLCENIDIARSMGQNAFNYYSENCTIEIMAKGFRDAINCT
jgi:glycosyltransferase involved in cell wall biosynthesis